MMSQGVRDSGVRARTLFQALSVSLHARASGRRFRRSQGPQPLEGEIRRRLSFQRCSRHLGRPQAAQAHTT